MRADVRRFGGDLAAMVEVGFSLLSQRMVVVVRIVRRDVRLVCRLSASSSSSSPSPRRRLSPLFVLVLVAVVVVVVVVDRF